VLKGDAEKKAACEVYARVSVKRGVKGGRARTNNTESERAATLDRAQLIGRKREHRRVKRGGA